MIVDFDKARAGEESFVWRTAPGDEYSWVTDPAWFDQIDEPVKTVRQQWQLICEDTVIFHPQGELCPRCHGEGVEQVVFAGPDQFGNYDIGEVLCEKCDGDGCHPKAGQMEVLW